MKRHVRQWLGMGGALLGTSGRARLTLIYSFIAVAVLVAVVNGINIIAEQHNEPDHSIIRPAILEVSSWLTLNLFLWIPWLAWRLAPPSVRPRWKLLLHPFTFLAFTTAHIGLFNLLRMPAFGLMGRRYDPGPFLSQMPYEMGKDLLGYALFMGLFSLVDHLLRRPGELTPGISTFDIRDGASLTRVKLEDILAIASAGNYVEFVLADGRRLLMRIPLHSLEQELAPRGFVRTHRSWLVNGEKVTSLKPDSSGDYTVELGTQAVPLSRRFPKALAKLRGP